MRRDALRCCESMTSHDLELLVIGAVLARPTLLKELPVLDGPLQGLADGKTGKLQEFLGAILVEGDGKTLDNVIAEWTRVVTVRREMARCQVELLRAKTALWVEGYGDKR